MPRKGYTHEQIAEAERLVEEWKPGSCEIERSPASFSSR